MSASNCPQCGSDWHEIAPEGFTCSRGHFWPRENLRAPEPLEGIDPVDYRVGRVCLDQVTPKAVAWLWPGFIPLGKVTILDGDPGLGKSTITADIAARLSTGAPMPDGSRGDLAEPAGVVIWSAEDGLGDTIRPRLEAHEADLERIIARESLTDLEGDQRLPDLSDLGALEDDIRAAGARLVVIDPLMAYMPVRTDAYKDHHVRRILAPLAYLAESRLVAIVVVRHLVKRATGRAIYAGGGSMGMAGAARSVILVAAETTDGQNTGRNIFASAKSNLSAPPPSLAYRIQDASGVSKIVWDGPVDRTADSLLNADAARANVGELERAKSFIVETLADREITSAELHARAESAGIKKRTLDRARKELNVASRPKGSPGQGAGWLVSLPPASAKIATD